MFDIFCLKYDWNNKALTKLDALQLFHPLIHKKKYA